MLGVRVSNSKPVTAAEGAPTRLAYANEALQLMLQALSLIDSAEAPDEAGAHLDFAIHCLREWIDGGSPEITR